MKNKFYRYGIVFLYLMSISSLEVLATEKSAMSNIISIPQVQKNTDSGSGVPDGLMVEFIREPSGVIVADNRPEYSWIVPEKAVFQKAFQILVSSSEGKIDQNIGDIWNSTQIRSQKSANIEHDGERLKPHRSYYWKVCIWDQNNLRSDYSSVQVFTTGRFDESVSTKNCFEIEKIPPVIFKKTASDSYFIDFGRDAFGTLELTYRTDKTETLIVRLGERTKNGRIDRDPDGTIRYQEVELKVSPQQIHYLLELPPDSRNTNHEYRNLLFITRVYLG